jgi:hypothetical protein
MLLSEVDKKCGENRDIVIRNGEKTLKMESFREILPLGNNIFWKSFFFDSCICVSF